MSQSHLRLSGGAGIFFFNFLPRLQHLLLDNESKMMAAKCSQINLSAFSTMTAQFSSDLPPQCMSLRADADYIAVSWSQFECKVLRSVNLQHDVNVRPCVDMKQSLKNV